jgi:pimeloyl-ACP methyl ester carboxylesterase
MTGSADKSTSAPAAWHRWLGRGAIALGVVCVAALLVAGGAVTGALKMRHLVQQFNADADRIVAPGGIDEAQYVQLGGVRQWITIRGQDRRNPLLLFLHGGPGGALADIAYHFARPWEDYFVVVQWDQRGYGRSNVDGLKMRGTVTKERYIADGIELIDYLRKRMDQPKVVLVGQSWGTLLGAEIAHRRPDLLHALVSFGQITAWEGSYEGIRQLLLDLGRRTGDRALEKRMQDAGPVPVNPDPAPFFKTMDPVWDEMNRRGYSWHAVTGNPAPLDEIFLVATLTSPTVTDGGIAQLLSGRGRTDYYPMLHPTISGWNLERDVGTQLAVPYILVMGRYDWQTPVNLAEAYYAKVCAPYKVFVDLPNSAHVAILEEPGRALVALVEQVLPAVSGHVPPGAESCAAAPRIGQAPAADAVAR